MSNAPQGEFNEYIRDDIDIYVSLNSNHDIGEVRKGWEKLLEDVRGRSSRIRDGRSIPEGIDKVDVKDVGNLAEYLDQNYEIEDIRRMTENRYEDHSDFWDVEPENPDLENGSYLIRIRGLEEQEIETIIGFP